MLDPLQIGVIVGSLVLALVVLGYVVLDRHPDWGLLAACGVVETAALVLAVVGFVELARGDHDLDAAATLTVVGYLLAALVVIPLAFAWSLAERSRGATTVLLVAALTEAFLVARVMQTWQG